MIFCAAARPAAASGAPDAGEESPQATRLAAPSIATAIMALARIFADMVCSSAVTGAGYVAPNYESSCHVVVRCASRIRPFATLNR